MRTDVLALLNVSNHDCLACDSGFIFLRLLSLGLRAKGATIAVVGLETGDIEDVTGVRTRGPETKYESRFSFDWESISKAIRRFRPEIVLVGQPEQGSAIRAVLETTGHRARLVTYCHYLPVGGASSASHPEIDPSLDDGRLGLPIQLAVVGSCHVSDRVLVQSEYAACRLEELAMSFGTPLPAGLVRVAPPPYDPVLLCGDTCVPSARVLYNHRLYRHYGADFLIELASTLAERVDHELLVLDVLSNRNAKRNKLDSYVVEVASRLSRIPTVTVRPGIVDRTSYRKVLRGTRVGLAPYRPASVWSMSAVDCLGMGVPVVAPDFACFPEMVPPLQLYRGAASAADQIEKLLRSDQAWKAASAQARSVVQELSPSRIAEVLLAK